MEVAKQVIVFAHFKGGVGTSFLASNVALELAKNKILTCLIDFDTKFPNCANMLGIEIKKKYSMQKFFNNNNPETRGDYFINDKNISPYLYLLSSSSEDEVEALEELNDSYNEVEELLNIAKEAFDIVVIDLPLDYQNPQMIESIQKADKVLVVGDLDINTIENSFRGLAMFKSINIPLSKFVYIPNKFFDNSDITISTIQETLGIRIGPIVQMDYHFVFDSILKSKPVVTSKNKTANSIRDICSMITGSIKFDEVMESDKAPKVPFGAAKEEVAATNFKFVYHEEEGENTNGDS